jgi:hypothetical protein
VLDNLEEGLCVSELVPITTMEAWMQRVCTLFWVRWVKQLIAWSGWDVVQGNRDILPRGMVTTVRSPLRPRLSFLSYRAFERNASREPLARQLGDASQQRLY